MVRRNGYQDHDDFIMKRKVKYDLERVDELMVSLLKTNAFVSTLI